MFSAQEARSSSCVLANYVSPFTTWIKAGLEAVGIRETKDLNSGSLLGTQYNPSTINPIDETRCTSEAFLANSTFSGRLHLYTNTLVHKVLFNDNKQATGVKARTMGRVSETSISRLGGRLSSPLELFNLLSY